MRPIFVFAAREDDMKRILLNGGHTVEVGREVGNVEWVGLSGGAIQPAHPAEVLTQYAN